MRDGRDEGPEEVTEAELIGEDSRAADVYDVLAAFARRLMSGDGASAAQLWEAPAYIATDDATRALDTPEQLAEFFRAAGRRYEMMGVLETHAEVERIDVLTENLLTAMTRWPYLDAYGQEEGCEYAQYLLRRGKDGRYRIAAAIMLGPCEPH